MVVVLYSVVYSLVKCDEFEMLFDAMTWRNNF